MRREEDVKGNIPPSTFPLCPHSNLFYSQKESSEESRKLGLGTESLSPRQGSEEAMCATFPAVSQSQTDSHVGEGTGKSQSPKNLIAWGGPA